MKRVGLLHLITALEPAGAENLLVGMARKLDKSRFRLVVGYIYGKGTLAGEIRKTGAAVVDLSRKGKIDPLLIIRILLLIRRENIKIVHTHLVHATIAGRIASRLAGVRTIVTTRHYAYHPKEENLIFRLERSSACLNKMTVAISPAVEEHLIRVEGYDPGKVTVILNAVDPRLFAPIADERQPSVKGDHVIVSVGHLHHQKGHDVLIRGMTEITREIPEAKLLIIGDGPQKAALKRLVQELQLSNRVDLLGSMPPAEVIQTLKGAHVFALASNWEGFGIAVIEAMASGKPVVATDVEGLRDVVKEGSTGFLVPRGESGPLAEKIILLLRNPNLRLQMGREGRKRVEVLFSLDNMMVGLETMYRDLLSRTAGKPDLTSSPVVEETRRG